MMKYIILALVFFTSCSPPAEESDELINFNPNQDKFKWSDSSLPISFQISNKFSDEQKDIIYDSAQKWNEETEIEFFGTFSSFDQKTLTDVKDYYLEGTFYGIHLAEDTTIGITPEIVATCQLYIEFDKTEDDIDFYQIKHADIILNGKDYDFDTGAIDLETVMIHEFGHTLGLIDSALGTMNKEINENEIYTEIDDESLENIWDLYPDLTRNITSKSNEHEGYLIRFYKLNSISKKLNYSIEKIN